MDIHADVSFTERERGFILEATTRMYEQTRGFVDVNVVFDLNFDDMDSLRQHAKDNIMTRIDHTGLDKEDDPEGVIIGYCSVDFNDLSFNNPTRIALVYDRLPTEDSWIHVAMHEMLHALRQQHVAEPKSILFKSTPVWTNIVTCLTASDMEEICEVHGCDLAAMLPCIP
jgi:hypothetical protein